LPTNIESEDDIDIKIIEKHIEDIEKQHENQITHFIHEEEERNENRRHQQQNLHNNQKPLDHPAIQYDKNTLKDTLEALSDRTTVSYLLT
jgi:hypothetical protein